MLLYYDCQRPYIGWTWTLRSCFWINHRHGSMGLNLLKVKYCTKLAIYEL
jgi:hypothetical protein